MPNCPNCGIRVAKTANFCTECGFNLKPSTVSDSTAEEDSTTDKSEKELLCPSCGKSDKLRWSLLNKSWICDNCGKSFDTPGKQVTDSRWVTPLLNKKVSRGDRRFPLVKVIVLIIILAAIGIPVWWLVPTFTLEIASDPADGGSVTGVGDYHRFTDAQINATPNECFEFTVWNGTGIANPDSSSTTVRINDADRTVTAKFERVCIPPGPGHQYWEYLRGKPINDILDVDNNELATNPSWSQLKTFLTNDKTDQETYDEDSFVCRDFSLLLHHNSEEAGIKAAFVGLHFVEDDAKPHALNAFNTTDAGLVFVDCTGSSQDEYNTDKIAYPKVGEEYGQISLDDVKGFSYGDFQLYWQNCELYEEQYENALESYNEYVRLYNARVQEHNERINICGGKCTYYTQEFPHECHCALWKIEEYHIKQQEENLEKYQDDLEKLQQKLCEDRWKPGGTVQKIEIWW